MIDNTLPPDLVKELASLRERLDTLERQQPQIAQPIPRGKDHFPINSSGFHDHPNATDTLVNSGRCAFTAQYLHYTIESSTSLLGGGATQVVGIQLNVPGLVVKVPLTEQAPGIYFGGIDLYDQLGEVNRGRELTVSLYSRRVGGTGSSQCVWTNNPLLRVHDYTFYGG